MSRQLNLRIPDADYEALEALARECGLTPMQQARAFVVRGVRCPVAHVTPESVKRLVEVTEELIEEAVDGTAPLSKPSPPKKPRQSGAVCSECQRKNGGRPRRDCPNGCDKGRRSALEQFDVEEMEG